MAFVINSDDHPGSVEQRLALRPEHLEWLRANTHRLLAAGAKRNEAGEPVGSLVIVDTDDLAEATEFAQADPYSQQGLFAKVEIVAWNKSFFNYEDLI